MVILGCRRGVKVSASHHFREIPGFCSWVETLLKCFLTNRLCVWSKNSDTLAITEGYVCKSYTERSEGHTGGRTDEDGVRLRASWCAGVRCTLLSPSAALPLITALSRCESGQNYGSLGLPSETWGSAFCRPSGGGLEPLFHAGPSISWCLCEGNARQ